MNRVTLFDALNEVLSGDPKSFVMKSLQDRYELSRSAAQEYFVVCTKIVGLIADASEKDQAAVQKVYNRAVEMREHQSTREALKGGEFPLRIKKALEKSLEKSAGKKLKLDL